MKKLYAIIAVFFLVFTLSSQATVSAESLSSDHNDGHAEEQEVDAGENSAAMEQENENDLSEEEQEEEQVHNNNAEESAADISEDENQEEQEDESEKQNEQTEAENENVENAAQSEEDEKVEETEQDDEEDDYGGSAYPYQLHVSHHVMIDKDLEDYEGFTTEIEIDEDMDILNIRIDSSDEFVDFINTADTEPTDFEYERSGHSITVNIDSEQLIPYEGKYIVITAHMGFVDSSLQYENDNVFSTEWEKIEGDPNPDPAPEEDPEPSPSPEEPESDSKPDNESKPEQETESTPEPNPAPKSDEESDETVVEIGDNENNDNEENRLPDTATNIFNVLGIAFALFAIGVLGLVFSRKRQTN